MKLGSRNIEWILVIILVLSTMSVYLFLSAGMLQSTPQSSMTIMTLIMIFGGQMLLGIILLRIYDKLSSVLDVLKEKK